jgi:hypothetical protein
MTNLKLNDPSLLETRGYVNGQWIEKDQTFAVMNPATGEAIAHLHCARERRMLVAEPDDAGVLWWRQA